MATSACNKLACYRLKTVDVMNPRGHVTHKKNFWTRPPSSNASETQPTYQRSGGDNDNTNLKQLFSIYRILPF